MLNGNNLWHFGIINDMGWEVIHNHEVFTYKNKPNNLYETLLNSANKYPDRVALCDNWGHKDTYSSFLNKVTLFAQYLQSKNVRKRHHVGLLLHNSREFAVAFYACAKIGAVSFPFPTKYRMPEIEALINQSDLDYLITTNSFEEEIINMNLGIPIIVSQDEEKSFGYDYLLKGIRLTQNDFHSSAELSDEIIVMFTSGTTSQSKGVVLRNYNVIHAIITYQRILDIRESDKTIIPIPIYHITGLVALLGLFVFVGGTIYLYQRYDAKQILDCIEQEKITFMHGSPTVFSKLLEFKTQYACRSLRKLGCGSSYTPVNKLNEFHEWLPFCQFQVIYGMTETSSPALICPYDSPTSIYATAAGIPIPGVQFKICSDDGKELKENEIGELFIKGACVAENYYKLPDSEYFADGWLSTGDMAYFNNSNYIFIVDRKKDMINRGGEKIWCIDLEEELNKLEEIQESSVVGIADPIYGEVAVAVAVLNEGYVLDFESIKSRLKKKLATFKIPTQIKVVTEIPKTAGLKIDKRSIRKLFE